MNSMAQMFGVLESRHPLRDQFMGWQCRVRQLAMREQMGRPDDSIRPMLTLAGEEKPFGRITTVISKGMLHSKTPELQHMVRRTFDAAQRREKAIEFFSETYYQRQSEFSEILTATFPPHSSNVTRILDAETCTLVFEAYAHRFELACEVKALDTGHPLYQATWWHNLLFNPDLHPETTVLAFKPDWDKCRSDQAT